jgi:orotidine-5'-phosphate decarboxylase
MKKEALTELILKKQSYLCIGLDTDLLKLPDLVKKEKDPVFTFNQRIIDATAQYCVAYKPNLAFYESMGPQGWEALEKTLEYLGGQFFTIADAKRGDIGNTSALYARTFFERYKFDAVTVAPYMGSDSVTPFLGYPNKWVILLALTSNPGSEDFQQITDTTGRPLYETVLTKSQQWAGPGQMMYVVGATHPQELAKIRTLLPDHFLLVPGYGTQGGDLKAVSASALTPWGGLLVNASRAVIYASDGPGFQEAAKNAAQKIQQEMARYLEEAQAST